jgi:hypothetical protein
VPFLRHGRCADIKSGSQSTIIPFHRFTSYSSLRYYSQSKSHYSSHHANALSARPTMAVSFLTILAGLVALTAAYVYFCGIPPELKRKMERQALKTMGENKMSYMTKDAINKVPASDQENVKSLKKGVSNLAGGAMQNPLGEQAGEAADTFTSPLTGR